MDFKNYAVACVFLGHSAGKFYNIGFDKPYLRDNLLFIPYKLIEIRYEMAGPFEASGQYHMKVFRIVKGLTPILEEIGQRPLKNRIYR